MAQSLRWELGTCPSYNPEIRDLEFRSSLKPLKKKVNVGSPAESLQRQELLCGIDSV